jgi:hypothetical protein
VGRRWHVAALSLQRLFRNGIAQRKRGRIKRVHQSLGSSDEKQSVDSLGNQISQPTLIHAR